MQRYRTTVAEERRGDDRKWISWHLLVQEEGEDIAKAMPASKMVETRPHKGLDRDNPEVQKR
eukprot:5453856-Lingulodinium_polyedra.AAC.1